MQIDSHLIIINDADAIIALINEDDSSHKNAVLISRALTQQCAFVLTPVTAVIEAITALKRAISRPDLAKVIITACMSGGIPTIDVPADILPEAIKFFNPESSKKDTMFDAVMQH